MFQQLGKGKLETAARLRAVNNPLRTGVLVGGEILEGELLRTVGVRTFVVDGGDKACSDKRGVKMATLRHGNPAFGADRLYTPG